MHGVGAGDGVYGPRRGGGEGHPGGGARRMLSGQVSGTALAGH
jgi:hypothetical protein